MSLKANYANVEYTGTDGEAVTVQDVRIIFADRLRFEKTAKARGWDPEKQPMTSAGFISWAALNRSGQFPGSYEDFLNVVIDVEIDDVKSQGADDTDDPTQPAL
jgi:hypothetical protein